MTHLSARRNTVFIWLLAAFTVFIGNQARGEDVFASSADIKILAEEEKSFIGSVKVYLEYERQRISTLERLVAEVENEMENSESMDHPLNVINLIHRFTTKWNSTNSTNIYNLITDFKAYEVLQNAFNKIILLMPKETDYTGAKTALIRLHKTYALTPNDTINGTVLGHKTKPMSQQMAVDIGLYTLSRGLVDDALEWLTHALNHLIPPLTPMQDIYHAIARVYAKKGDVIQSLDMIQKALEIDPSNSVYLSDINPTNQTEIENPWPETFYFSEYSRMCTESIYEYNGNFSGNLSCFHKYSDVIPFYRYKVEPLHLLPDLLIFHGFVTDNEAMQLRTMAISKINVAMVGHIDKQSFDEGRVGKIGWFWDSDLDPLISKLSKRISQATGLSTIDPSGEALQLSNYGIGGHYSPHYDYFVEDNMPDGFTVPSDVVTKGDRIATFMIYLNNVIAGGATIFPDLKVATQPIPNAAIFWFNKKRSGYNDKNTLHAACPVLIGEKWVANKWIRQFGQEFRRPCPAVFGQSSFNLTTSKV